MYYSNWESENDLKDMLASISLDNLKEAKFGLPIIYGEDRVYVDSRRCHSLIIGATGSGKTQAITLPMLLFSRLAGESVVIHDVKGEMYDETHELFEKDGYKTIVLDFNEFINSNKWNPYNQAEKLYKEGKLDKAFEEINMINTYLLGNEDANSDPFWINSTINYFNGLCIYCMEKGEKINFDKIYELNELFLSNPDEFSNDLDKLSPAYINLSGVIKAPKETKLSILSVFSSKFNKYLLKPNLKDILSNSDFDLIDVFKEKTIIYIKSGNSSMSSYLLPIFITQICNLDIEKKSNLNFLLDDFCYLNPIKDVDKLLLNSRSMGINFTVFIRGYNDLLNAYGKEQTEVLKMCFANIVYLLSQDIETIKEISYMCGNKSKDEVLISVDELKGLKTFEAIIIMPRVRPIRTKLVPYYKIKELLK